MSASFPQVAFWVIFPMAALIVLSGWVMIIISAVKKLRAGKHHGEDESASRSSQEDPVFLQPEWNTVDRTAGEGPQSVPLS